MAGTLKTTFFNLVKYAANDITSWLTDFNGNMDKIDVAMNQNKTAVETAQDAVNNLESEYETVMQTLAQHTTLIDNNEKAIAATSTTIEELENDVSKITISQFFNTNLSGTTKVEPLVEFLAFIARNIGTGAEIKGTLTINPGTLHIYDRILSGGIFNGNYCTDLVRISGNPCNLTENVYTPFLFFGYGTSTTDTLSSYGVMMYLKSENYTILGLVSTENTQITFANKASGILA